MADVTTAFEQIERINFLLHEDRERANLDAPISIGFGQTNSQPSTVQQMLEWLDPQPGEKVLDVGSGSGWTSALLAHLVGKKGRIYAVEKIPDLVVFGRANCVRMGFRNIRFFEAGSAYGLLRYAPYDRILVSAAAYELPHELIEQLEVGGRLVIPVIDEIQVITKLSNSKVRTERHAGFMFVPLVQ